jgi:integrase
VRSDKCRCPFHADGIYKGQRIRQSLNTRSPQIAERKLNELLAQIDRAASGEAMTLRAAGERFLASYDGIAKPATIRKYETKMDLLVDFCERARVPLLADVTVDVLERFKSSRDIGIVTWRVELQALRTFFGFCMQRGWTAGNPARQLRSPRGIPANAVVPYTLREESLILAACDQIGGAKYQRREAPYERRRARAMVMLLRHTALRISDVCVLRKDAFSWDDTAQTWRILLRTQKSGEPVFLPIPPDLKLALDALPVPRKAPSDCPYYFWNGVTSRRAVVGIAERAMAAVFKKSGVPKAHPHRFRHTLATRLLGDGHTYELVADILGNSPAVVRSTTGSGLKGGRTTSIARCCPIFKLVRYRTSHIPVTLRK